MTITTSCTDHKVGGAKLQLETKDILKIIKACRTCGVDEFSFGELKFSFSSKKVLAISTELPKPIEVPKIVEERQMELGLEMNKRDELEDAEEEMAELLINNPEKYEELMAKGELVDNEPRLQH